MNSPCYGMWQIRFVKEYYFQLECEIIKGQSLICTNPILVKSILDGIPVSLKGF